MGTWGAGIYQSDSTLDYVEGIIKYNVNVIRDIMRWDNTLLHPGMTHSELVMCHIDILNAICSREGLNFTLPETKEIKKWKEKYLEVWEYRIDEIDPTDDYKTERYKVLKKSFNTLISLTKKRDRTLAKNNRQLLKDESAKQ